ncbi:MAG: adenylosuccinate synthetase [Elusimicrobiota bacterium]|jgi:adenylosuccinate synthase|nr:adenylosuccinate synthetase [Elusimicrobiota bacterium]
MIDIISGGQGGDEGKGKISAYLSYKGSYSCCVRIGGPNAGHTVLHKGNKYTLKNIPSGFLNPDTKLILGAGAYTKPEWLLKEVEITGTKDRLIIDPMAVMIEDRHTEAEKNDPHFMSSVGSVGTGLGQAVKERIERRPIKFAKDEPLLKEFVKDVPELLNKALAKGEDILVEGTQGFKLSLFHGTYPYVTSRDTTAATFLGEAGLGPKVVRDCWVIFKPYVSRVGPGPMEHEIFDEAELSVYHHKGCEIGSVSKRLRRIGRFEDETARRAIMLNSATKIAVTHIDLFEGNEYPKVKTCADFTPQAKEFLRHLKNICEATFPYPQIKLVSNGAELEEMVIM